MPDAPRSRDDASRGSHQLTDVTRGIHHAASSTMRLVAQHYIGLLDQYFDRAPDGTLVAKMAKVALDEKHYMLVPLVSLAIPRGLFLDRMRVEMAVRIDDADVKDAHHPAENDAATRSSFSVSFHPRAKGEERDAGQVDIVMEFASMEPPEAIMRVLDAYTHAILPVPTRPGDPPLTAGPNVVKMRAPPLKPAPARQPPAEG